MNQNHAQQRLAQAQAQASVALQTFGAVEAVLGAARVLVQALGETQAVAGEALDALAQQDATAPEDPPTEDEAA